MSLTTEFDDFLSVIEDDDLEETPVDLETFLYDEEFLNMPPLSAYQIQAIEAMTQVYRKETLVKIWGDEEAERLWKTTFNEVVLLLGKGSTSPNEKVYNPENGQWSKISELEHSFSGSVLGVNLEDKTLSPEFRTESWIEGWGEMVRVTTELGFENDVYIGHKFLGKNMSWVQVSELSPGDSIGIAVGLPIDNPVDYEYDIEDGVTDEVFSLSDQALGKFLLEIKAISFSSSSLDECKDIQRLYLRLGLLVGIEKDNDKFKIVPRDFELQGNIYWDKIVSIEPLGEGEYWTLTAAETHSYVGEGMISQQSGKDMITSIAFARIIYLLLCLKDPARYYGKPPGDAIAILNVAINAQQAKNVFFRYLKTRIKSCKWFEGKYDPPRQDSITFDKNLEIYSGHSEREAWEGYNLIACFSGDTEIITWDGIKKIKDVSGTTQKLLSRENRGAVGGAPQWVDAPIKHFGQQRLMKVTVSRGKVQKDIFATPEHRWHVKTRSRIESPTGAEIILPTSKLRPGHRLPTVYGSSKAYRISISPYGVVHGLVCGDGSAPITQNSNQNYSAQISLFGRKSEDLRKYFHPDLTGTEIKSGDKYSVDGYEIRGLPRHFKQPPPIDESPAYLFSWLAGYFAADGSIDIKGQASLHSKDLHYLEFAQLVCIRLGIHTLGIRKKEGGLGFTGKPCTMYRLVFPVGSLPDNFFLCGVHKERNKKERQRTSESWKVVSVEETDRVEDVYCAVVDGNQNFCLDGNILTGNCTLDEIAGFASKEEGSAASLEKTADGLYDMYKASVSSRFPEFGKLVLLSFPRYEDDFISRRYNAVVAEKVTKIKTHRFKMNEEWPDGVEENEFDIEWEEDEIVSYKESGVFALRRPTWAVNPIIKINDFKQNFRTNYQDALGRFACQPPKAISGFFNDKKALEEAFPIDTPSPFRDDWSWQPFFKADKNKNYYIHVDLAYTYDRAAVAMCSLDRWATIKYSDTVFHNAPVVTVDAVRYWEPRVEGNIEIEEVKNFIVDLKRAGFRIKLATFDRWQSLSYRQQLQKDFGIETDLLSVSKPHYEDFALALTERRVKGYNLPLIIGEILQLKIIKGNKIDHTRRSTKDISDAVCGAVYNVLTHEDQQLTPDIEIIVGTPPPEPEKVEEDAPKAKTRPPKDIADFLERLQVV